MNNVAKTPTLIQVRWIAGMVLEKISIHAGVKPELWQVMLEMAREYGQYPLRRDEA